MLPKTIGSLFIIGGLQTLDIHENGKFSELANGY